MNSEFFKIETSELNKFREMMIHSPREFQKATVLVLNTLAFATRKAEIKNITGNMIIRNRRFVESSVIVSQARPSGTIESQISEVGSVIRSDSKFSGWKEQEGIAARPHTTAATALARGGSYKGQVKKSYRLNQKFPKPRDYQGRNINARYQFMMRILNNRGGAQPFEINEKITTKRGALGRGVYLLKAHKIQRLQKITGIKPTHIYKWREISVDQTLKTININHLWGEQLLRVFKRTW